MHNFMIHSFLAVFFHNLYLCTKKKNMKKLGQLIEHEVRKQNLPITNFADMIYCERNNVYNIFKRSKMDVAQLGLISKALNHNFFEDIVKNPELTGINDPEIVGSLKNDLAVAQFQKYVPDILVKIGYDAIITFGRFLEMEDDLIDLPDFILTDMNMAFTIGQFHSEYERVKSCKALSIKKRENENGVIIYDQLNLVHSARALDINIVERTYEQWEEVLRFAFEIQKISYSSNKFVK